MARDENVYRFIIADDHPLFRDALRQTVAARYPRAVIVEAATFDEVAARLAADDDVDLVLLDLTMPGAHRLSGLLYLRAEHPAVPIVIVSASEDVAAIRQAMSFGASGYITKSLATEVIGEAIATVLGGAVWAPPDIEFAADRADDIAARLVTLTPQQVRVLMMLSDGLLNKQIAHELSVSEATVKAHVSAILQKLGVGSRTQAVIAAAGIEAGQWPLLASPGHP
jgi:DNA-binding NarL/FixJ family response regulator